MSKLNPLLIGTLSHFYCDVSTSFVPFPWTLNRHILDTFYFMESLSPFSSSMSTACKRSQEGSAGFIGIHIFCTKTDQLAASFSPWRRCFIICKSIDKLQIHLVSYKRDHRKKLSWHLIKSVWRRAVISGNIYGEQHGERFSSEHIHPWQVVDK